MSWIACSLGGCSGPQGSAGVGAPAGTLNVSFSATPVAGGVESVNVVSNTDLKAVRMYVEKAGLSACGDPLACAGAYDAYDPVSFDARSARFDYPVPNEAQTTVRFRIHATTSDDGSILSPPQVMTTLDSQRSGQTYIVDRGPSVRPTTRNAGDRGNRPGARSCTEPGKWAWATPCLIKAGIYQDGDVQITNSGAPGSGDHHRGLSRSTSAMR